MTSITVGIVDDHPLFREGVTRSLSEIKDFLVVGEGATSDDAAMIAADQRPDVMLVDVSMPGGGLSAIGEILQHSPSTKVLMLTASEEIDTQTATALTGAHRDKHSSQARQRCGRQDHIGGAGVVASQFA